MKKNLALFFLLIGTMILGGCLAGPNAAVNTADAGGNIVGFWTGLWHGFILPVHFVISLLNNYGGIFYEVHNNGGWYHFGFVIGVGGVWGFIKLLFILIIFIFN